MRRGRRLIIIACAALLAAFIAPAETRAQLEDQPLRVLIVYGVSPELLDVATFTHHLRLTLRSEVAAPVEFYQEYLDLDRFPDGGPALVSYFADKYQGFRIDA